MRNCVILCGAYYAAQYSAGSLASPDLAHLQPCHACVCLVRVCVAPAAGAGYHLFAGREVARALAKVAVEEAECNDK